MIQATELPLQFDWERQSRSVTFDESNQRELFSFFSPLSCAGLADPHLCWVCDTGSQELMALSNKVLLCQDCAAVINWLKH